METPILPKHAVIIGAGLTGLTTALYLKKAGWDVLVLEKESEIGGAMKTITEDGFTFETGANTGVLGNPEVAELFDELSAYTQLEIANSEAKKRLILKNGKFHALPTGLYSAVTTPLFSFYDKFRILGEPFRKKGTNPDESVAQITRRRMGRSFLDYAIDPFVSGIYAGNPEQLTTRYALPKLWALEQNYGSLIKGGIKRSKQMQHDERLKRATRDVMAAYGGFGKLIQALATSVGNNNIKCLATNIQLQQANNNQWQVSFNQNNTANVVNTNYVISTIGAHALPPILSFVPQHLLNDITNVTYAKVIQITLGFKQWKGGTLKAFGGLIPSKENRKILGVLFTSSFLKNRAPEGGALLAIYMGGIRHPEVMQLSDDEIKTTVLQEVSTILQCPNLQPDLVRIFRHPYAIPQYEKNTEQRLAAIDEVQKQYPHLIIAGNLRNGIGMADRVKQARTIAEQLIAENL